MTRSCVCVVQINGDAERTGDNAAIQSCMLMMILFVNVLNLLFVSFRLEAAARETGLEAVMRVRVSKGVSVSGQLLSHTSTSIDSFVSYLSFSMALSNYHSSSRQSLHSLC